MKQLASYKIINKGKLQIVKVVETDDSSESEFRWTFKIQDVDKQGKRIGIWRVLGNIERYSVGDEENKQQLIIKIIQFRETLPFLFSSDRFEPKLVDLDNYNLDEVDYVVEPRESVQCKVAKIVGIYFDDSDQNIDVNTVLVSTRFDLQDVRKAMRHLEGMGAVSLIDKSRCVYKKGSIWVTALKEIINENSGVSSVGLKDKEKHKKDNKMNKNVFIVHGHDELLKEKVKGFIGECKLNPIILHEQSSGGRTVPEKLEKYDDVNFAIILLTPDDEGRKKSNDEKDQNELKDRARQNVLIELGYFWAKLGRSKVHALYIEGVEIPTDYGNVIYTPFDKSDGWKLKLFKELKEVWPDISSPF